MFNSLEIVYKIAIKGNFLIILNSKNIVQLNHKHEKVFKKD